MPSFNQVILIGHMTRDPKIMFLADQTPVVSFGIATNHRWKSKSGEEREDVCFVDCAAFGRRAEVINEHFKKGKPILVRGRLRYETWEDKQGNGKRSKHTIAVDDFAFVGGSKDEEQGGAPRQGQRPISRGPGQRPSAAESPFPEENVWKEEDIPFHWMPCNRWI